MSTPNNRRRDPGVVPPEMILLWVGIITVAIVVGVLYLTVHLGHRISDTGADLPGNPFAVVFGLVNGKTPWPPSGTAVLIATSIALLVLVLGGWLGIRRLRKGRTRVDRTSAYLGKGSDVAAITKKSAEATASRLGVDSSPGVAIGKSMHGDQTLYGSWEDMHLDIWGPRTGKAVESTTPVLTPNGWVPIKALARGCRVIGRDGRPTTVTGVYPQGIRPAYRMHFSDGTSVLCDADHVWTVRPKLRQDKPRPEMWREWTTAQLLDNGLERASGGAKYYLPLVEPVEFDGVLPDGAPYPPPPPDGKGHNRGPRPDAGPAALHRAELRQEADHPDPRPVDPYLLGVLIGDASFRGSSVVLSTGEPTETIPRIADLLPSDVEPRQKGSSCNWRLSTTVRGHNSLVSGLRELGLMGHTSLEKFIPEAYLLGSVEDRRALLRGLLDTDGSIDQRGLIEYSTSSPQLADDMRFLVQALGGTVSTTRRETTHAPSYRMFIRLPRNFPSPFRIRRKSERWEATRAGRRSEQPVRAIVAIEPEGDADMVCISVAADDGLFVIDNCIVTHNTTSRAIPAILDAPGAVLVTSNKRDVVDATRDVRGKSGPVWVFDPQEICREQPSWWWNPLSYVTDEVKAAKLADHFAAGSRDPGAKSDAFFDPAGQDLLAGLLLAAALDGYPITQVYSWLTRPTDETAVDILRDHGFPLTADQVAGVVTAPERQRGGIYGTAAQMASCLTNRQVSRWITPQSASDARPQFNPADFVNAGGTLYSLSKEGRGTAGPLVTALTVAVVEAAEEIASRSPGGRLQVPMLGVLDEAANVCRWRDLPDLYSHYGSRGIVLMTILQSWSQGVDVWGESGMKKLWSASNVKVYGGGVAEAQFLEDLSKIVGDYDRVSSSTSYGKGQRSVSQQLQRERILDVSDLAAMPKGRALVLASGARPTLVRTQPWMAGSHAAGVRASIANNDPQSDNTIREAETSLASVMAAEKAAGNGQPSGFQMQEHR